MNRLWCSVISFVFLAGSSAHAVNSCITGRRDEAVKMTVRAIYAKVGQALAKKGITLVDISEEETFIRFDDQDTSEGIIHSLSLKGIMTTERGTELLVELDREATGFYYPALKSKGYDREGNDIEAHCTLTQLSSHPQLETVKVSNRNTGRQILKVELPKSIAIY